MTADAAEVKDLVRYIHHFILLMTAFISFVSLPATAQTSRTFYIDYASGSNANNGTISAPWKSHPYMQSDAGCTGTGSAPAYSHQAGDHFIFKGGVTWPAACFQLSVTSGGSSAASDYYGVDLTWSSGASFTRPVFDMANNTPAGYSFIKARAQYIVFDNLELKRMKIVSGVGECNDANMDLGTAASGYITVKNMYIHDWTITTLVSGSTSHGSGAICQNGASGPINVDTVTMDDAATTAPVPFGACFRNLGEIKNSDCEHTGEGEVGLFGPIHDNTFANINGNAVAKYDSVNHTNILEIGAGETVAIYNNVIHDNSSGVTIYVCGKGSIYNNVFWRNYNQFIKLSGQPGGVCGSNTSSDVMNVYNNTADCSNGSNCFGTDAKGTLAGTVNLENNHWITNGAAVCVGTSNCSAIATFNQANNVTMSTSTATSEGYTTLNWYIPTSSSGGTVGRALDLANLCSGGLGALCSDRLHAARLTSWDVGAYEFGSQTTSKPNPPGNLNAIVQ